LNAVIDFEDSEIGIRDEVAEITAREKKKAATKKIPAMKPGSVG
jgi:hypothetical protein